MYVAIGLAFAVVCKASVCDCQDGFIRSPLAAVVEADACLYAASRSDSCEGAMLGGMERAFPSVKQEFQIAILEHVCAPTWFRCAGVRGVFHFMVGVIAAGGKYISCGSMLD